MRHVQIARLTWVLTGLFAAGAVAFAATRPAPEAEGVADPSAAAAAFEAHCAACHGQGDFPGWAARRPNPAERRAWLDDFLQRHHPPHEEDRALVIEHIEQALADGD
jgi:mono/diheme cytochrome c family protein